MNTVFASLTARFIRSTGALSHQRAGCWWVSLWTCLLLGAPVFAQEPAPGEALPPPIQASSSSSPRDGGSAELTTRSLDWLLDEAAGAWEAGDYARTAALYRAILDKGVRNGSIHYNLGNALLRQGELGQALYQYRLAQLFLPRDGDVEANLGYARQKRTERLDPAVPDALERLLFWTGSTSLPELYWTALIGAACFWIVLSIRRLRPAWRLELPLGLALLLTLLALGSGLLKSWRLEQQPDAVVLEPELSVRSGTDKGSVVLFTLHQGAEVQTRSIQDDWVQLELSEGKRGWVEKRFVGLVR